MITRFRVTTSSQLRVIYRFCLHRLIEKFFVRMLECDTRHFNRQVQMIERIFRMLLAFGSFLVRQTISIDLVAILARSSKELSPDIVQKNH